MKAESMQFVRRFLVLAMTTISVVVLTVFVAFHLRTEKMTSEIILQQGRALFEQMIMTRRWISDHGGVFVKVRQGVDPDPFLTRMPGVKVNIRDEEGNQYTMRNPGLVVRGISELAEASGTFRFHVASLNPINKTTNTPDSFERAALESFEKGSKESHGIEQMEEGPFFRYMAPLFFEEKCNKCHAFQNHKIGDILGGISVSIPMNLVDQQLKLNRIYTVVAVVLVLFILFLPLLLLSRKFMHKLDEAQSQLVIMATVDALTGLFNRKIGMERLEEEIAKHRRFNRPLSLLMFDVDHFKSINDTYGHQAGDTVLESLAGTIKKFSRKYDVACRYGGEEFMMLLPETGISAAIVVAEKLQQKISENPVAINDRSIRTTVSIGVTQMARHQQESAEEIVSRADKSLYKAKEEGRNQVRFSLPPAEVTPST